MVIRYLLTIAYDGTEFYGWQKQPDTKTVQGELERVIGTILQHPVEVQGQGRTDRGVHAMGQTAHVDLPIPAQEISKFRYSVNSLLPETIFVKEMIAVNSEFHARFDATSRAYEYRIRFGSNVHQRLSEFQLHEDVPWDDDMVQQCASLLIGEHDFSSFCKSDPDLPHSNCTIYAAEWVRNGPLLSFEIEGNRFLRNMVRRLVGAMVLIGKGELRFEEFKNALCSPSEIESAILYKTAPAQGLMLKKVKYRLD